MLNDYYHATPIENSKDILKDGYIFSTWFLELRKLFQSKGFLDAQIMTFLSRLNDATPDLVGKLSSGEGDLSNLIWKVIQSSELHKLAISRRCTLSKREYMIKPNFLFDTYVHKVHFFRDYKKSVLAVGVQLVTPQIIRNEQGARTEEEFFRDLTRDYSHMVIFQTKLEEDFYQACVMGWVDLNSIQRVHVRTANRSFFEDIKELSHPYKFKVVHDPNVF